MRLVSSKYLRKKYKFLKLSSICVGEGWYYLLDNLLDYMSFHIKYNKALTPEFKQIKQKFGGLRLYVENLDPRFEEIIKYVEYTSFRVCENCGSTNNVELYILKNHVYQVSYCKDCILEDQGYSSITLGD